MAGICCLFCVMDPGIVGHNCGGRMGVAVLCDLDYLPHRAVCHAQEPHTKGSSLRLLGQRSGTVQAAGKCCLAPVFCYPIFGSRAVSALCAAFTSKRKKKCAATHCSRDMQLRILACDRRQYGAATFSRALPASVSV